MPFGLRNAAQTFMDQVLRGISFAYAYMSSLPAPLPKSTSDTYKSFSAVSPHMESLSTPTSTSLASPNWIFSDITLTNTASLLYQRKSKSFEVSRSQRQLRQFMGMVNFYHRFLPHSSVGCIGHEACGGFCCGVGEMHSLSPPSSVEGG